MADSAESCLLAARGCGQHPGEGCQCPGQSAGVGSPRGSRSSTRNSSLLAGGIGAGAWSWSRSEGGPHNADDFPPLTDQSHTGRCVSFSLSGEPVTPRYLNRDGEAGRGDIVGYARCSTTSQDLTAQRQQLAALGAPRTGSNWTRG